MIILIFSLFLASSLAFAPLYTHSAEEKIAFSYIIKLRDSVPIEQLQMIKSTLLKMHPTHKITHEYKLLLNGFAANLTSSGVKHARSLPQVEYVQEDGVACITQSCNIQNNPPSWNLNRVSTRGCPVPKRNFYEYHIMAGQGVRIFILDTGIRITHVDFQGRAAYGANFIPNEGPEDGHGHGTHVAGTACSATYGVAKMATCISVKVLSSSGSGSWAGVISGIEYVGNTGAPNKDIINISLGGGANKAIDDAVDHLVDLGIFVVVAGGNNGGNACNTSPGRAPKAFTVGALLETPEGIDFDRKADWSNFGACVSMYAPGEAILSCHHTSDTATATMSGTSMASPLVAGIAAIINSVGNGYDPDTVKNIFKIEATTDCIFGLDPESPNLIPYASIYCD